MAELAKLLHHVELLWTDFHQVLKEEEVLALTVYAQRNWTHPVWQSLLIVQPFNVQWVIRWIFQYFEAIVQHIVVVVWEHA